MKANVEFPVNRGDQKTWAKERTFLISRDIAGGRGSATIDLVAAGNFVA